MTTSSRRNAGLTRQELCNQCVDKASVARFEKSFVQKTPGVLNGPDLLLFEGIGNIGTPSGVLRGTGAQMQPGNHAADRAAGVFDGGDVQREQRDMAFQNFDLRRLQRPQSP